MALVRAPRPAGSDRPLWRTRQLRAGVLPPVLVGSRASSHPGCAWSWPLQHLQGFFQATPLDQSTDLPNPFYWAGNEPDILAPYQFNAAGRPDLTQFTVRQVLNQSYSDHPNGVPGNNWMARWKARACLRNSFCQRDANAHAPCSNLGGGGRACIAGQATMTMGRCRPGWCGATWGFTRELDLLIISWGARSSTTLASRCWMERRWMCTLPAPAPGQARVRGGRLADYPGPPAMLTSGPTPLLRARAQEHLRSAGQRGGPTC
jgi:hypothetical protein